MQHTQILRILVKGGIAVFVSETYNFAKAAVESHAILEAQYEMLETHYATLEEELTEALTSGNQALYMTAYLSMKLATNDVKLTTFDLQVLHDPPGYFGKESPTLFEQLANDPMNPELIDQMIRMFRNEFPSGEDA